MASLVIIDATVKEKIKSIIEHAEKNITTQEELKKVMAGESNPVGDSPEFTVLIPTNIKAVFSYEEQPPPVGVCKHLSVSVNLQGRVPNFAAVIMVMKEFGFENGLTDCILFTEKFGDGTKTAVNVIEPKDGKWDPEFLKRIREANSHQGKYDEVES